MEMENRIWKFEKKEEKSNTENTEKERSVHRESGPPRKNLPGRKERASEGGPYGARKGQGLPSAGMEVAEIAGFVCGVKNCR